MALISVLLGVPTPALLWRYGEKLRGKARETLVEEKIMST
jgi:hypothetical protein